MRVSFVKRGHCVCVVYFWLVKEVDSLGEGVRGDELFATVQQIKNQVWSSGIMQFRAWSFKVMGSNPLEVQNLEYFVANKRCQSFGEG